MDPACRPPRSQRIPHKPGKVVVQMVVYLSSPLTQRPVLASFLQGGSEDTLSVSELKTGIPKGSRDVPLIPETHCPAVGFLLFWRPMASRQNPGKQKIVVVSVVA
jgi:hypothetical protein